MSEHICPPGLRHGCLECEGGVEHLPCPFCGGDADPHTRTYTQADADEAGWPSLTRYGVNCSDCGAEVGGPDGFETSTQADAAWNRRTGA